jgi:hypothetical protein
MNNQALRTLSLLLAVLAVISCGISIFNNDIYQDGAWANAQWLGQDVVTLLVATPLLLIARHFGFQKQNWKWYLVGSGVLFYFIYTYAFFAFVAELTFLYLFHLPIFGLAVISFVLSLLDVFGWTISVKNKQRLLKRIIIGYLLVISAMLIFIWMSDIISHLTIEGYRSDTPDGEAPLIIYSLDLGIVIPLMILSAVAYWRKKQYGYLLTGIMLTKTSLLGFALMAMAISMYVKKLDPEVFLMILWFVIGIIGGLLTFLYLRQLTVEGD